MSNTKPQFIHDCDQCVFLGRGADQKTDLYFCATVHDVTLIARYSDEGSDYASALSDHKILNGPLSEAQHLYRVHGRLEAITAEPEKTLDDLCKELGKVCYASQQNRIAQVLVGDDPSHKNYKTIKATWKGLDDKRRRLCAEISALLED